MKSYIKKDWQVYLMFSPVLIWIIFFVFVPFGLNIIISFQDYTPDLSISGSKFVKFSNYKLFFTGGDFGRLLSNTVLINLLMLIIGFPLAIILAIMIFESENKFIKNFTQTALFLPFFISAVVVSGILIEFLKQDTGIIVHVLSWFGVPKQALLSNPKHFRLIYALMDTWQTLGYNMLIYYAALTVIDKGLYEAAKIDGANKFRQIWHITLPGIMPIVVTTLLLKIGRIMQLGYEKVLLLQNSGNISVSEIIGTYVYNVGLNPRVGMPNYGLAAAVGIFDAFVAVLLIYASNKVAKKVSGVMLW